MGGGGSKKASDKSLEVEQQIINRQQQARGPGLFRGDSPQRDRSKSVNVAGRSPIPQELQPDKFSFGGIGNPMVLGASGNARENLQPQAFAGAQSSAKWGTGSFGGAGILQPQRMDPVVRNPPQRAQPQAQRQPANVRAPLARQALADDPYADFYEGDDLPPELLQILAIDSGRPAPADAHFQDEINEAIIQSMFEQEQNAEEEQLLREVMKISALEHQKQIGVLNLDHLKKRKKPEAVPEKDLGEAANKSSHARVNPNDLPPLEVGGKKGMPLQLRHINGQQDALPRIRENGRASLKNEMQDLEEQKFLDIINANDTLAEQKSNPYQADKGAPEQPISHQSTIPSKKKGSYKDEDDFNHILLNSSPKKNPKNQHSHAKEREWEQLEEQVSKDAAAQGNGGLGDLDDLIEGGFGGIESSFQNSQISPQRVDKNLSREMMKERKSNILNQGIQLQPTDHYQMPEKIGHHKSQAVLDKKHRPIHQISGMEDQQHPTETTKANGRSKYGENLEDSSMMRDEEDEAFERLIGNIEKVVPQSHAVLPTIKQVNLRSQNQVPTSSQRRGAVEPDYDEDFF